MELNVVGVVFGDAIKPFYFSPNGLELKRGDKVVVETSRGLELGEIAFGTRSVDEEQIVGELRPVVRLASESDLKKDAENNIEAKQIFSHVKMFIKNIMPDIKVSFVRYNLDHSRMIISYTSDDRIDYRDLVKRLAGEFHTRIEMHQIGYRDEVAVMGAIGECGQVCCCKRFLKDFDKVSIKMAKEQGIALNPNKINGICGRLLCCLKYEDKYYHETLQKMPKINSIVTTPDGDGKVVFNDILREKSIVTIMKDDTIERKEYDVRELKFFKPAVKQDKDNENNDK